MDKKILINANHPEEKRVAIIQAGRLMDFYVEIPSAMHLKGNIYKGRVAALDRGLQAAFVDFGPEKHGFLPLREVMRDNFAKKSKQKIPLIHDVMEKGQEILVQVEHDRRGQKGAKLTNYVSLPGRYLVMIPGEERVGISRKIEDSEVRDRLKEAFKGLKAPKGMGFILRTAGADRNTEELAADLKYLTRLWNRIKRDANKSAPPILVYKEEDIAVRTVRDYLGPDVSEVIVDERDAHRGVKNFLKMTMPWRSINVALYKGKRPLFDEHGVEEQIAMLGERTIELPSGGSIVIDRTEALTAIDVNSARAKGKNTDDMALETNLEAAEEAARQMRLRDIGGLIVIDFIDLEHKKGYQKIEDRLRSALSLDKAHFDTTRISRFGLLEMSRERMRSTYHDSSHRSCPSCHGEGVVMSPELLAVSALRTIGSRLVAGNGIEMICRVPVDVANLLLNSFREKLAEMERQHSVRIKVISDPLLHPGEMFFDTDGLKPSESDPSRKNGKELPAQRKKRPRRRKTSPLAADPAGAHSDKPGKHVSEVQSDEEPVSKPSASKKRRMRRKKSAQKKSGEKTTGG